MSGSPLNSGNTKLNQVLQNYRLFAMNDLRGPASALLLNAEMAKFAAQLNENYVYKSVMETFQANKEPKLNFKHPAQLSGQPETKPFLMKADSTCVQAEAILEGELIACFEIGGEKRLCLPQIFNTVLSGFSLDHVNQACDKLFIYCSRCNAEQLELFRKTQNLPPTATTCGLITMTDAERLCTDLLHGSNDSQNNYLPSSEVGKDLNPSENCIPVYHECFGEGTGFFKPELYCSPDAKCIQCTDCGRLFSTKRFVGHSHKNQETRVCHWGFDRNNWRSYLLLADDLITDEKELVQLEQLFNGLLSRFAVAEQSKEASSLKRKIQSSVTKEDEKAKARRFSDSQVPLNPGVPGAWMLTSPPMFTFPPRVNGGWTAISKAATGSEPIVSTSVKARLPTQKSCPPTLENPDRVVPSCESNRYEKHFVPNIALQQSNESEEENVKVEEDNESAPSMKQEADKESKASSDSYLTSNSVSHPYTESKESQTLTSVLENLAKMENLYMHLLQSTRNLSPNEKDIMEQKYISCSDTIRRHILPGGSSIHDDSAGS